VARLVVRHAVEDLDREAARGEEAERVLDSGLAALDRVDAALERVERLAIDLERDVV
jgi:hypothetical protein